MWSVRERLGNGRDVPKFSEVPGMRAMTEGWLKLCSYCLTVTAELTEATPWTVSNSHSAASAPVGESEWRVVYEDRCSSHDWGSEVLAFPMSSLASSTWLNSDGKATALATIRSSGLVESALRTRCSWMSVMSMKPIPFEVKMSNFSSEVTHWPGSSSEVLTRRSLVVSGTMVSGRAEAILALPARAARTSLRDIVEA